MPKKKPPFFYFMCEVKEKEEKNGIKMSMEEASKAAAPLWEALSPAEKDRYKKVAKEKKMIVIDLPRRPRYPEAQCVENYTEDVDSDKTHIKKIVCDNFENESLNFLPFYFLSFNIHCCDDELIIPREVAIVRYTIKNGLEGDYHAFIKPSTPLGRANEAKENASFHGIPSIDFCDNKYDYKKVFDEIVDFISEDSEPIVFCQDLQLNVYKKCLRWLYERTSRQSNVGFSRIRIYPASVLLMELRAVVGKPYISVSTVLDILGMSTFDYAHGILCEFHMEIDNLNCALAYSKKLAYIYSSEIYQYFDVSLTPNHLPSQKELAASIMQLKFPETKKITRQPPLTLPSSEGSSERFADMLLNTLPVQPKETNIALERAKQTSQYCAIGRGRGMLIDKPAQRPGAQNLEEYDAPDRPPAL